MNKKYSVNLTKDERWIIFETINAKDTPKTVRTRCSILLLADNSVGEALTQQEITARCEVSDVCVYKTVKNYDLKGLEYALRRRKHQIPPRKPLVSGEEEARIITLACSKPPEGFARWTLRLLTKNIIEQEIIPSIGRETVRKTLKKRGLSLT
jgi:transposase